METISPRRFRAVTVSRRLGAMVVCAFAVVFGLGWPASVVGGAEPPTGPVKLRFGGVGFGQNVRADQWATVRATLLNYGPDRDVELRAYCDDAAHAALVTRADFHLPAQSTRRVEMFVNTERGDRLTLEVYDRDRRRLAAETFSYTSIAPRDLLVVGLSTVGDGFSFRHADVGMQSGNARVRFNNTASFDTLPARWAGYDASDVIILGSLPPGGVPLAQEQAVLDWVRAGGTLILTPGREPNDAGTVFERISPVQRLGYRLVDGLPPLEARYARQGGQDLGPIPPAPRGAPTRIGFWEAIVREGVVLMEMDGLPLVVSRREGAGSVVFVAFDLSSERLTTWFGLQGFYRDLIERRGAPPRPGDTLLPRQAALALNEAVGVPVLPRAALALCLIVNLACLGGLFYAFRRRHERGFLAIVIAAPVLALVVNGVAALATGVAGVTLTGRHVIRSNSGARACSGSGYFAVLSPGEARCTVRFPGVATAFARGLSVVTDSNGERRRPGSASTVAAAVQSVDGDIKELRDLNVRPRALTMFQADYEMTLPGPLEAIATPTPSGVRVQVRNRGPVPLTNAWVVCNRNAASLGDVAPGAAASALLTPDTARGMMAGFAGGAIRTRASDVEHEALLRAAYAGVRPSDLSDTGAVLLGWIHDQPVSAEVLGLSREPAVSAETLWIVIAERAGAKGRVLLPKGVLAMQFRDLDKGAIVDGRWGRVSKATTLESTFTVPAELVGMKASRIDFFLRFNRGAPPVSIEALNVESGKYDPIFGDRKDGGIRPVELSRTRFTLAGAEKYLSKLDGKVTVRVRIVPDMPSNTLAQTAIARLPVIEDFDLEIEGTRE